MGHPVASGTVLTPGRAGVIRGSDDANGLCAYRSIQVIGGPSQMAVEGSIICTVSLNLKLFQNKKLLFKNYFKDL